MPNTTFSLTNLLDLQAMLDSGNGTAQVYISLTLRNDLDGGFADAIEYCGGVPVGYTPPDPPLLDVGPALGILSGIDDAIGILEPYFSGNAGIILKAWLQEMRDSIPHTIQP